MQNVNHPFRLAIEEIKGSAKTTDDPTMFRENGGPLSAQRNDSPSTTIRTTSPSCRAISIWALTSARCWSSLKAATPPQTVLAAVGQLWGDIQERDFWARAEAFAEEIAAAQPLLIGLQEVPLFVAGNIYYPTREAAGTAQILDYLDILLDHLNDRGLSYTTVATTNEFSGAFTALVDPLQSGLQNIQYTDRDVILRAYRSGGASHDDLERPGRELPSPCSDHRRGYRHADSAWLELRGCSGLGTGLPVGQYASGR